MDVLNFFNRDVSEINGSCIHEKGSYEGYIGDKDCFLLLTLFGTSKSLEYVDTGFLSI